MELDRSQSQPTVCFASAHPAKFPEAVTAAGLEPQPTPYIKNLGTMPQRFTKMTKGQDWEKMLRDKITEISRRANAGK